MIRNPEAKPEHNFKVGQVMVVTADTSGHGLRLNTTSGPIKEILAENPHHIRLSISANHTGWVTADDIQPRYVPDEETGEDSWVERSREK